LTGRKAPKAKSKVRARRGKYVDFIQMRLVDPNLQAWDDRLPGIGPGTYNFEVERVGFDQSRKGNRALVVTARVVTSGPMQGRTMRQGYVLAADDFSRVRLKKLVEATGAVLDGQGGFTAESLVGLHFTADVVEDTFDDINPKTGKTAARQITKWIMERPANDTPMHTPIQQTNKTTSTMRRVVLVLLDEIDRLKTERKPSRDAYNDDAVVLVLLDEIDRLKR